MSVQTLEVDFKRVAEWLTERHKLPEDWNRKLKALKLKLNQIIESSADIGARNIKDYLSQKKDSFNFLHLQNVVTMMENSDEAKNKNFFGQYSNQNMRDWIGLQKLYQNGNLHIVDLAKQMIQNVQYDMYLTGLKRNQTAIQQQLNAIQQRVVDYRSMIKQLQVDYETQSKRYGIAGLDVEYEVPAMVSQLPSIYKSICSTLQDQVNGMKECLGYYKQFTQYACGQSPDNELLILKTIQEQGDISVDSYRRGQREDDLNTRYRWYYDQESVNGGSSEWEIVDQHIKVEVSNEVHEIDWNQYTVGQEDQQVSSSFVDTLLSNSDHRNELISNLNEVLFFLRARVTSSQQYSQNALLQTYEGKNDLFEVPVEQLSKWVQCIQSLLTLLSAPHFRMLLTLMNNKKAQLRIIDHLKGFTLAQQRTELNIRNSISKQADLEAEHQQAQASLVVIVEETLKCKTLVETYLSELVKCKVVLTGDVNKIKL